MSDRFNSSYFWDTTATTFDDEPDHGLSDSMVRQAWAELMDEYLPADGDAILDIGCGTGSLSLLLASKGYQVVGIDVSPKMIEQAKRKAAELGLDVTFTVGDAATLKLDVGTHSIIICRHLLWVFDDFGRIVKEWAKALRSGGRLLLIEGYWHTGGGLHAEQLLKVLEECDGSVMCKSLIENEKLWGKQPTDERYIISFTKN